MDGTGGVSESTVRGNRVREWAARRGWTREGVARVLGSVRLRLGGVTLLGMVALGALYARESRKWEELPTRIVRGAIEDYLMSTREPYLNHWDYFTKSADLLKPEDSEARAEALLEFGRLAESIRNETGLFLNVTRIRVTRTDHGETVFDWRPKSDGKTNSPAETGQTAREGETGKGGREIGAATTRLAPIPLSEGLELRVEYQSRPAVGNLLRESSGMRVKLFYGTIMVMLLLLAFFLDLIRQWVQGEARARRDAAREVTLWLADRTCHELGNLTFRMDNQRRNLSDHLKRVDDHLALYPGALESAMRRAGIENRDARRVQHYLRSELEAAGLDPYFDPRAAGDAGRGYCREIETCSKYLKMTVQELDVHLRSQTMEAKPEPTGLEEILGDALTLMEPRLEAARGLVEVAPARGSSALGAMRVIADRRRLVHALINLLKNGLEAAESARREPRLRIEARVSEDGETTRLLVTDNGPGFADGFGDGWFQEGYSTKGRGRGRGLSIVREAIEAQGGRVEAFRPSEGGAGFRVTLRTATATTTTSQTENPAESGEGKGSGIEAKAGAEAETASK